MGIFFSKIFGSRYVKEFRKVEYYDLKEISQYYIKYIFNSQECTTFFDDGIDIDAFSDVLVKDKPIILGIVGKKLVYVEVEDYCLFSGNAHQALCGINIDKNINQHVYW